jgi:hypothetical protein
LAIGRRVVVAANLEQVLVTFDGVEVARYARSWAHHQTITDPDHAVADAAGRRTAAVKHAPPAGVLMLQLQNVIFMTRARRRAMKRACA